MTELIDTCYVYENTLVEIATEVLEYYFTQYKVDFVKAETEKGSMFKLPVYCVAGAELQIDLVYAEAEAKMYYNVWDEELEAETVSEIPYSERYSRKDIGGIKFHLTLIHKGKKTVLSELPVGVWTKAFQTGFTKEDYFRILKICITKEMNIYFQSDLNAYVYMILQFISIAYGGYASAYIEAVEQGNEQKYVLSNAAYYMQMNTLYLRNLEGCDLNEFYEDNEAESESSI